MSEASVIPVTPCPDCSTPTPTEDLNECLTCGYLSCFRCPGHCHCYELAHLLDALQQDPPPPAEPLVGLENLIIALNSRQLASLGTS
jgi:hypothetical protein